jgi:hypothetical protein
MSYGNEERNTARASRSSYNKANRYFMPVTHDVGAFSWEWRHKSHKKLSMGCLPSRFVAFGMGGLGNNPVQVFATGRA